ncbi:MAG: type II secretion system protein GspK [Candidatus Hydrogenedentes bacterium]|nr:type II secretion system protein GspK [Candidatus Hydrogenedentota bacterium]
MKLVQSKKIVGFVLVSVMWIIVLLTIIVTGFGRRVMLDRRASAYSLDIEVARSLAHSAVQRGIMELRNKIITDALKPDEMGCTYLGQPWAKVTSLIKDLNLLELENLGEEDDVFFQIIDEERKINLNSSPTEILDEVSGISKSVIRQILKRRTEPVHSEEGITPFQVEEELRYLRGVEEEDWYGTERKVGLKDMFTVYGDGKINLNTASESVLKCIPKLGDESIRRILGFRAGPDGEVGTSDDRGFKNILDVQEKIKLKDDSLDAINRYCKFNSSCYRIIGEATLRNGKVRVRCYAVVYVEATNANLVRWQEETIGV